MPKTLTAAQAKKLAQAESAYTAAKDAFEAAKAEREAMRERYRDRVPLGEVLRVGGLRIKRRVQTSGPSFRLAAYLADHKLTQAMRPYVNKGTDFEVWDVRPG